jgi:hypothetical protein
MATAELLKGLKNVNVQLRKGTPSLLLGQLHQSLSHTRLMTRISIRFFATQRCTNDSLLYSALMASIRPRCGRFQASGIPWSFAQD